MTLIDQIAAAEEQLGPGIFVGSLAHRRALLALRTLAEIHSPGHACVTNGVEEVYCVCSCDWPCPVLAKATEEFS